MKKFLISILMVILITSCGVSNRIVTLGNVSILSKTGEKLRSYNNVILEEIPIQDTLTSIHFFEQNGNKHYLKNSIVVIEGVKQIKRVTSTTYVVNYPYGYYRIYYYYRKPYCYYRTYHYRQPRQKYRQHQYILLPPNKPNRNQPTRR